MRAQVLRYSRTRGVFAGLELNGAAVKQDKDSTREFYNHMVPLQDLAERDDRSAGRSVSIPGDAVEVGEAGGEVAYTPTSRAENAREWGTLR